MDSTTLINSLRSLKTVEIDWTFALYGTHKGSDGLELDWHLCKMRGISDWVETLRTVLLEKTIPEKSVADYSPFHSDKEIIGAMENNDDLIRDQLADIVTNIQNGVTHAPEDFVSGVLPKIAGFAFYGESRDDEGRIVNQVLFMRRGNPFLSGQKIRLCTSAGDEIVTSNKPVMKFTPAVDFLMINEICYFFSSAIEKDFSFENRHFAIAGKKLAAVAENQIVSDYEALEKAVFTAKNARKFADFDKQVLKHIVKLPIADREEFLSTYGVIIDTLIPVEN